MVKGRFVLRSKHHYGRYFRVPKLQTSFSCTTLCASTQNDNETNAITMGIISRLLILFCSNSNKTGSKVVPNENSGYKLYVQYEDKKELKKDSEIRISEKSVGKVIAMEQNPEAFIVTLFINEGVEIPLLSKFKIVPTSECNFFINIQLSNDNRFIRANEYFIGEE